MTTMELMDTELLQNALTQRIAGIDDPGILDAFLKITDKYYKPKPLTAEQLEDIEISRQQFAAGLGIPHEEVMKEFDAEYPDDED